MPKIAEVKLSSCGLEVTGFRKNNGCIIAKLWLRSNISFKSCGIAIAEVLPSSCGFAIALVVTGLIGMVLGGFGLAACFLGQALISSELSLWQFQGKNSFYTDTYIKTTVYYLQDYIFSLVQISAQNSRKYLSA